jgi:hypothetical protein
MTWSDPLALAAILAMAMVTLLAIVDIAGDGQIEPGVMALFIGAMAPLVPAFLARINAPRNGKK